MGEIRRNTNEVRFELRQVFEQGRKTELEDIDLSEERAVDLEEPHRFILQVLRIWSPITL
jgi:hypothetical protein